MKTTLAIVLGGLLCSATASAQDAKAERTWKAKCASCHGDDGKGQTEQGKKQKVRDISTAAWQAEFSDDKIKAAIENGVKEERDGVKKSMDPYASKLKPDQIDGLVKYIRTLKK